MAMFSGYSDCGESGSKLEKILVARKSGLFSKWHTSGLKVSDPVLKIGNNGTYEICVADNKQKINFKGLQDGNVDFKVEKKSDGYTCGFTKKMKDCCTAEYEVESKGDTLNHSVKVDGNCYGVNGFVKVGGDVADPTVHSSFFFDVPMVSGLRAVMDAKSKMSGGCVNITGLHYSGVKDMTVSATIKNATANAEIAVDVTKKVNSTFDAGAQVIHHLKSSDTNVVGAVGYHIDRDHTFYFKFNKSGALAFQLKKAFSPSFNLELGCCCSAADLCDPKKLQETKLGLKLNLKF